MEAHADTERERLIKQGTDFGLYLLERNPFIRLLAISGSLTNERVQEHDDSDYFIVSKAGRVWECFAACVFYGMVYSRKIGKSRTFFCFNYLIDEKYSDIEIKINVQSAREFLNLKVIYGHDHYKRILENKKDIKDYFPEEYETRLRSSGEDTVVRSTDGLFFIITKPAFKAAAKAFEYRRRMRHKTGKIYSNDNVIRSHLHI